MRDILKNMTTVTINTSHIGPRNAKTGIYVLTIKINWNDSTMVPQKPTKFNAITGTRFAAPPTEQTTHCMLGTFAVVFGCAYLRSPCRKL